MITAIDRSLFAVVLLLCLALLYAVAVVDGLVSANFLRADSVANGVTAMAIVVEISGLLEFFCVCRGEQHHHDGGRKCRRLFTLNR